MPDIFGQYHPARAMAAILCMLLFLACLGLFAWSSNKGATVTGPVHITASTAHVVVTLNGEILVLDTNGALQERRSLEALGIDSQPIDLRWQGEATLLVATQNPAGLTVCDYPAWQCRSVENPIFGRLHRQIKVLPDPLGDGLFISDTAGGRLYRLSVDGNNSRALTAAKWFRQVNDIALDDKRRLWVADSGNRRIVILQAGANGEWDITGELSAGSGPARPDVDWPMMIALSPDGTAWVVQPDATGKRADLLVYDAQLGVKARIDLPENVYPTDVVRSGRAMLVTDMDNFGIMSVDIDSHAVAAFGDHRVQAILEAAAKERTDADRMMDLALAGMALFGVLMIAMAIWATPKGQRFTPRAKVPTLEARAGVEPRSGSLHWLVRDAKTDRFVRSLGRILPVTTAAMLGLMVYTWYLVNGLLDEKTARQAATCVAGANEMLVVLGILILGAPVLGYLGLRQMRNRLGSDGHYLHIQLHDGQRLALDPAKLAYTGRVLAYRNHLFPIQTGNRKPLYAAGEIETHILPLLTRATRLGSFAMMRYLIRHQEPMTMASIGYIVVATATLWYTGTWRLMLAGN
jgi:hypothetical protein